MTSVGPILRACPTGRAIADAIRGENPDAEVIERGAYLRVSAPSPCQVSLEAIRAALGRPFELPSGLEAVLTSFKGRLRFERDRVIWESG